MRVIHFVAVAQVLTLALAASVVLAVPDAVQPREDMSTTDHSRLEASLVALESRLADLDSQWSTWSKQLDGLAQVGGSDTRVRAFEPSLVDMRRSMHDLQASISNASIRWPVSLQKLRVQNAQINWAAIEAIRDLEAVNYQEALRSVQLLSSREVLTRFGAPTEIKSSKGYHYWSYHRYRNPLDTKSKKTMSFYVFFGLAHGLVTKHSLHLQ